MPGRGVNSVDPAHRWGDLGMTGQSVVALPVDSARAASHAHGHACGRPPQQTLLALCLRDHSPWSTLRTRGPGGGFR